MQSVFITTKVASTNLAHGEVYSMQHCVIKCLSVFCSRSVVFSGYSGFLHQYNFCHDINEILLNVALNTITQTLITYYSNYLVCLATFASKLAGISFSIPDSSLLKFSVNSKPCRCFSLSFCNQKLLGYFILYGI